MLFGIYMALIDFIVLIIGRFLQLPIYPVLFSLALFQFTAAYTYSRLPQILHLGVCLLVANAAYVMLPTLDQTGLPTGADINTWAKVFMMAFNVILTFTSTLSIYGTSPVEHSAVPRLKS